MATATPKGLSMAEMRLLADFGNVIQAQQVKTHYHHCEYERINSAIV